MTLNILDYLEKTARQFPDKIALKDEKRQISFNDFELEAKRIGSLILACSFGIRKPIVVFVDRNIESIISFMGVVYSGNFYVPLDSKMPSERIKLIIDKLDPPAVIYISEEQKALIAGTGYKGSCLSYSGNIAIDNHAIKTVRKLILDIDPLYSIFTSGSTGIPKGVVISHKSVIDLTEWLVNTFEFSSEDVLGNQTPFYFDGSVKDIYIALKTGASLHILPKKFFAFPRLLFDYINENNITSLLWATSAVSMVGNSDILTEIPVRHVNRVFFAGEAMPAKQLNTWRKYLPLTRFINLYGPTEVTVDCTYYIVEREFGDDEFIPIGWPCRNKEILLLGENNKLISESGEIGEICVRGTGVALGYYNDSEKTDEVFVQNPLHNFYEDKIYRTGDLAKYNEQGELVFVSRKDYQIKHMGNRIELGEIEVVINSLERVTSAACIYLPDKQKIALFYVTSDNKDIDIINSIKAKLPKYMFPNLVYRLDEMPLNSNGKTDRIKLQKGI